MPSHQRKAHKSLNSTLQAPRAASSAPTEGAAQAPAVSPSPVFDFNALLSQSTFSFGQPQGFIFENQEEPLGEGEELLEALPFDSKLPLGVAKSLRRKRQTKSANLKDSFRSFPHDLVLEILDFTCFPFQNFMYRHALRELFGRFSNASERHFVLLYRAVELTAHCLGKATIEKLSLFRCILSKARYIFVNGFLLATPVQHMLSRLIPKTRNQVVAIEYSHDNNTSVGIGEVLPEYLLAKVRNLIVHDTNSFVNLSSPHLASLTNLRHLLLSQSSQLGLSLVTRLPQDIVSNIRSIDFMPVPGNGVDALAKLDQLMPKLNRIQISTRFMLDLMQTFSKPVSLSVECDEIQQGSEELSKVFKHIKFLPWSCFGENCTSLRLYRCRIDSFYGIEKLHRLKRIEVYMSGSIVNKASHSILALCPSLQELSYRTTILYPGELVAAIKDLIQRGRLQELSLMFGAQDNAEARSLFELIGISSPSSQLRRFYVSCHDALPTDALIPIMKMKDLDCLYISQIEGLDDEERETLFERMVDIGLAKKCGIT